MLQTCPNHLSKSACELRFSRLLLPESHAQCVLIHTGTPDSQVAAVASSSKQQQQAASSSKLQQAAASSSKQQQAASSSQQQPQAATSMCPLERMTKYKYKFEKSWQKWLSGQHLYTIVSIGIPMEVAARFKRATFKLSCKTQAKRKKCRLTPIAFPHGNEPFNCKQNRFPHPPVAG